VNVAVSANPAVPVITADLNAMTLSSNQTTGNQWYFEGVQLFGETAQVLNLTFDGSYTVQYTVGNCTSESAPYVYSVSTGVFAGTLSDKIQVYPNPSEGIVKISLKGSDVADIIVKDIYGTNVYTGKMNGSVSEIDLSILGGGVYFVNLKNGGEEGIVKVVIE
jgi:hypothetical protein